MLTTSQLALAASLEEGSPATEIGPPGLTDLDGNGISDNLDAKLEGAAPNDRFAVIVSFNRPTTPAAVERLVGPFTLRRVLTSINGLSGEMTKAQIEGLSNKPGLFRIDPVSTVRTFLDEARFSFGAVAAAGAGYTGQGVSICVVDTGADAGHEQLDGKGLNEPGRFLDLVNGRNDDPYDDQGHGTHVAAIAAGDGAGGTNAASYQGVAPQAELYIAKVLDSAGFGQSDAIIDGMEWCAIDKGVDIISMSLGDSSSTDGRDAMSQAVNNLTQNQGVIVVAAAGNGGPHPETIGSPACARDSVAVAALESWSRDGDHLKAFSSRGPCSAPATWTKPDVAAPGANVTSAQANTASGYVAFSGTSMATPYVSGALALAFQANGGSLSLAEVRTLLGQSSTERGPNGHDLDWGRGLIDVDRLACLAAGGADCPPTPFPTYTRTTDTIPRSVVREYTFPITDTSVPIAATLDIVGSYQCVFFGLICGWVPDVELALLDPNGTQLDLSTCPADTDCGAQSLFGSGPNGRQETVRAHPGQTGTYKLQVWIADDLINDGVSSATFALDVSHGPLVGGGDPGDPGDPANQAPVANADSATTPFETPVTVDVLFNDEDPDNGPQPLSVAEIGNEANGSATISGDQVIFTPAVGYSGNGAGFTYTITDGENVSNEASVTITVEDEPTDPPPASSDISVGDLEGSSTNQGKTWTATVLITIHDDNHGAVAGAAVTGAWATGGNVTCTTTPAGSCQLSLSGLRKKESSIAFSVGNVSLDGKTYQQSKNHDHDGDSNGTLITVNKP